MRSMIAAFGLGATLIGCTAQPEPIPEIAPVSVASTSAAADVGKPAEEADVFKRMRADYEARLLQHNGDISTLLPLLEKWDDANIVASRTARIALAAQVSQLQELRREAAKLELGDCVARALPRLDQHMDLTIANYLLFMEDKRDVERERRARLSRESQESLDSFNVELRLCRPDKPIGL